MAALDFKEIPPAHAGDALDRFELFARDFLLTEGFKIIKQPDRGADGGRDIIVEEERSGPGGSNAVRWLVSCKHKAHSGSSVTPKDEQNIRDRVGTHMCRGFIAFYSTIPSSGLGNTLSNLKPEYEYLQLDAEAIERRLLDSQADALLQPAICRTHSLRGLGLRMLPHQRRPLQIPTGVLIDIFFANLTVNLKQLSLKLPNVICRCSSSSSILYTLLTVGSIIL